MDGQTEKDVLIGVDILIFFYIYSVSMLTKGSPTEPDSWNGFCVFLE